MTRTWRDAIRNMPPAEAVEHLAYLLDELTWQPDHGREPLPGVRLSSRMAKILYRLDASRGQMVANSALAAAMVDGRPGDAGCDHRLRVHVHHLRRRLCGTGVEIETVWGEGYRLLPGPALDWRVG